MSSPAKRPASGPRACEQRAHGRALVRRRAAAAPRAPSARTAARRPGGSRALGDQLELGARRFGVVVRAVVVREREALVLDRPVDAVANGRRGGARHSSAPSASSSPWLPTTSTPVDADHARAPSAPGRPVIARDERVARDEVAQDRPRLLGDGARPRAARRSARACRRRRAGSRPRSGASRSRSERVHCPYDTSGAPARRHRRRRRLLQRALRRRRRADHRSAAAPLRALQRAARDGDVARRDRRSRRLPGTIRYAFHGDVEWGYARARRPARERRRRRRHRAPAADAPRAGSRSRSRLSSSSSACCCSST